MAHPPLALPTLSWVHRVEDLFLPPHPETVVEALRAGVLLAGGPDHATDAAAFGELADGVDQSLADPFGSLSKRSVTERLRKMRDGVPPPDAGVAGAGLGLVLTYSVANQLIFSVRPGRLTEVTAVLHVGGSNRAAQERGTAVHFYVTGENAPGW